MQLVEESDRLEKELNQLKGVDIEDAVSARDTNVIRDSMLKFHCPLKWDSLELTNDDDVRYCGECSRTVHYCHTTSELHNARSEDKCVALTIVPELPDDEEYDEMGF